MMKKKKLLNKKSVSDTQQFHKIMILENVNLTYKKRKLKIIQEKPMSAHLVEFNVFHVMNKLKTQCHLVIFFH